MTLRPGRRPQITLSASLARAGLPAVLAALAAGAATPASAQQYPVTPGQRSTAQQVAAAGVPLSELSPTAPDSYTVKRGDTLWAISKLFLNSPWRWPELWGMNLQQIHNPHLIYPGQVLVLEKVDGRARLKLANPVGLGNGNGKLEPQVRSESSEFGAIAAIPMSVIGPFLNDAMVFENADLEAAPRIVATQEGRVLLSQGERAYVSGDISASRNWQLFRSPKALVDPDTKEVLGYEARYVGSAERVQLGETRPGAQPGAPVPATVRITSMREEANIGDRLMPAAVRDFDPFMPHAPEGDMNGAVVSVYGDALSAGNSQIITINRGKRDGVERGHVLALWREGRVVNDPTQKARPLMKLPDERSGLLFVFRVFDRVSYALVMSTDDPVKAGDRFSRP